jgi:hypothetical protein
MGAVCSCDASRARFLTHYVFNGGQEGLGRRGEASGFSTRGLYLGCRSMDYDADLRLAALAYVSRVTEDLEEHGVSVPPMEQRGGGWRAEAPGGHFRYSLLPAEPAMQVIDAYGRQRDSDEHRAFVEALRRHPVLRDRVDTAVGTGFSSSHVDAAYIPEQLMWSMPAGELPTDSFDQAFDRLVQTLTREGEDYLVIAPLVNLNLESRITFTDRIDVDLMTAEEAAACLSARVIRSLGSTDTAWVHTREAIRIRDSFPISAGDEIEVGTQPLEDATRRWSIEIEEVLHGLRLYKEGQVWVEGAVGFTPGSQSYMGLAIPHSSVNARSGTYELSADDAAPVRALWDASHSDRALGSRPLQTALRRFGFAGERTRAEDQLIDLVIAAEAVFLTDEKQESAHKLAERSALFLGGLVGTTEAVFRTMKRAYNARSTVAHGGAVGELAFADGGPATLDEYVTLVGAYMRATLKKLLDIAAAGDPLPMKRWDELTLARLSAGDSQPLSR